MRLGGLIAALEALPPEMPVLIDYGSVGPYEEGEQPRGRRAPGRLHSYRGGYDHLALEAAEGYREEFLGWHPRDTVGSLLVEARAALGSRFEGYKGGEYLMGADTPIWVADDGESTGWGLMAIDEVDADEETPTATAVIRVMDIGEYRW